MFGAYINMDPLIETHFIRKLEKDPMSNLIKYKLGLLYNEKDPVSLYFGDERSFIFSFMPKY